MGELVDARTAAERLGVDVRTLYAYVSRGALRRVPGPDGRSSRYDSDELGLLARRSRPRTLPRPAASIDLVIATRVSTVTDGVVRYRGADVIDLVAAGAPFEAVAELLWEADAAADGPAWQLSAGRASSIGLLLAALGTDVPVAQRFAAVVASVSGAFGNSEPRDWPAWGRFLVAALVEASGSASQGVAPDGAAPGEPSSDRTVAGRLWRRWSPLRPTVPRVRALNIALVVLAEHELALSTLAVRVAASARAAPPGCVLAGLGALSGALHGDVPRLVHERLLRLRAGGVHRGGNDVGAGLGFGHSVHRHGDPRTAPLLNAVYAIATPADRDLIQLAARGGEPGHPAPAPPNSDFSLGALCHIARMPPEAATAIFAVARTAGWIAHAAEEYAEPHLRFRGRAVLPAQSHRR
jgi:citrate synthase